MTAKKIMIVEDEAIAVMTLEDVLEEWGYEVCAIASSAEDAIDMAKEYTPDVILMDINLNGDMDGIDAAKRIGSFCAARIIFITGYVSSDYAEKISFLSTKCFLEKPVDFARLHSCIE